MHPSDHLYHLYNSLHHHGHLHEDSYIYNYHNDVGDDEDLGDYDSDLVDEVLEVNTSKSKSDLNMSDETSSTLPLVTSDQDDYRGHVTNV